MRKYTSDVLRAVVPECRSYAEVIRSLGLRQSGGTQALIRDRVIEYGIDTSHFGGQSWSAGLKRPRREPADRLVRGERRVRAAYLRSALIAVGRPYRCEGCGIGPEWSGGVLTLEVDHRDGDPLNNEEDNLRFMCPNCHSQTETYGSKNARR